MLFVMKHDIMIAGSHLQEEKKAIRFHLVFRCLLEENNSPTCPSPFKVVAGKVFPRKNVQSSQYVFHPLLLNPVVPRRLIAKSVFGQNFLGLIGSDYSTYILQLESFNMLSNLKRLKYISNQSRARERIGFCFKRYLPLNVLIITYAT